MSEGKSKLYRDMMSDAKVRDSLSSKEKPVEKYRTARVMLLN